MYILQSFVYLININTFIHSLTHLLTMKNSINMTSNTKANFIAFGIMAVILIVGIIYGMQLENSFYISENY